jgi:exopolysaccharide biosynthesis WecB/TagA/CpsF family protein
VQAFSSSSTLCLEPPCGEVAGGWSTEVHSLPRPRREAGGAVVTIAPPQVRTDDQMPNRIINSMTLVKNDDDVEALIDDCLSSRSSRIISFVNAHAFNICNRNREFADAVLQSDIILRDGIGMQLLFKALKVDGGLNMNGTDLIPRLLDSAKGQSLGILGTAEPYLSSAADQLKQAGHNVVVTEDGFQDQTTYLALIERHRPKIIILGMGMPKQELIAAYLRENVSYNPLLINAGALIDFIGGKAKRAPLWMRRVHLEWVFRLLNEPKRLFHRYMTGNLVFLSRFNRIRRTFVPVLDLEADLEREDLAV